jgi:hypothetical protein
LNKYIFKSSYDKKFIGSNRYNIEIDHIAIYLLWSRVRCKNSDL